MRYGRNPRKRPAMLVKRTNQRLPYTIAVTRQVDSGGIPLGLVAW